MKDIEFRGTALMDLRSFPEAVRREAGYQIDRVQNEDDPADWKPMKTIGPGVREIRVRDEAGAFRVIYVAKFAAKVYVLHYFRKKTSKADLDIAKKRFRDLQKELDA